MIAKVALDLPLYRIFDYLIPETLLLRPEDIGKRVVVPFGRSLTKSSEKIGILLAISNKSDFAPAALKPLLKLCDDFPALPKEWLALSQFCATYYLSPLGEVMHKSLPALLKRVEIPATKTRKKALVAPKTKAFTLPELTKEQAFALDEINAQTNKFSPFLLFGITGSGKTEVYLRAIADALQRGKQTLLLVPEINLTPQLEERICARFPDVLIASLHSELSEKARLLHFTQAFLGEAKIIIGTRLSIFTPLPNLGLIIVDEEHDASFKQQDGMRYSARDLAVFRAHYRKIPIVLGSATPSLETWFNTQEKKAYRLLTLSERAVKNASLPSIKRVDTRREKLKEGFSTALLDAIKIRLEKGEQSLIFLNRRGYAPVLACASCGFVSRCTRCAANLVLHLADKRLRCHHCGLEKYVPKTCPDCGNVDIAGFGRGTQRVEDNLREIFPEARILRVDRDSAKSRKQWEMQLAKIHSGEVDILVGTQMLSKGHDFKNLTLVGVLGADAGLFAADARAPERLFAQLMQVSGRAGRDNLAGEVIIQTQYPEHPLFIALSKQDYPSFANTLLEERQSANFPPFSYQAILRAEGKIMDEALQFLNQARAFFDAEKNAPILLYDAVPMRLAKLANLERAQLLVESPSRPALQQFLQECRAFIDALKMPSKLRWHIEVDPLDS